MYLLLLGVIAVGAAMLLVYYSIGNKKNKEKEQEKWNPKDKGKVIYLFDDEQKNESFGDSSPNDDNKTETNSEADQKPKKDE